eukprot:GILI01013183.1.p1 GENE.GILI01013183.1~~GILI01013183.1.p1  ORF type:complete len:528 (+),score=35.60 GILI01013183.1:38-1585(+)
MTMSFWNRLKVAEATRNARKGKALIALSNNSQRSATLDAKVRYLHGCTEVLQEKTESHMPAPWVVCLTAGVRNPNPYEQKIKQAQEEEEDKRLNQKMARDRMEKAIHVAAGKLRRESILAQNPMLAKRNRDLTSTNLKLNAQKGARYVDAANLDDHRHFKSEEIIRDYEASKQTYLSKTRFNARNCADEDPRHKLDEERDKIQFERTARQRQLLGQITAEAYALSLDKAFTKSTNFVDENNRRHPRMYSVENDIDSDTSSDAEYFSLDNKPVEVLQTLESGKVSLSSPLYDPSASPRYIIDMKIVSEMKEHKLRKPINSHTEKEMPEASQKLYVKNADAQQVVAVEKSITSDNTFKSAIPVRLNSKTGSGEGYCVPTRPQSVNDHLKNIKATFTGLKMSIHPKGNEVHGNQAIDRAGSSSSNVVILTANSPTVMRESTTTESNPPSSIGYVGCESACEQHSKSEDNTNGVPQTARARLGVGSHDYSFIVPTRPSASSRPPTATKRPQSAGLKRVL